MKPTGEIVKALNRLPGVRAWRANAGRKGNVQMMPKGFPDIFGHRFGHAFFIEVKQPGEKRSQAQLDFMRDSLSVNADADFVESIDDAVRMVLSIPTPDCIDASSR